MAATASRLRHLKSYSQELGLNLKDPNDRFEWFLASILFAKRISTDISKRTFVKFQDENLVTPDAILEAGWDVLVRVLDSGGYVRYDFSTASNLLDIMKSLRQSYGSLEELHKQAESPRHLEKMLMEFKGVGPVGVSIFLRELRGIWKRADPAPSQLAIRVAQKLGVPDVSEFESQLIRLNLEHCKKGGCDDCPVQTLCKSHILRSPR
jgi:endonuclease III